MSKTDDLKVVRRFGKTLPWLAEAVEAAEVAADLSVPEVQVVDGPNNKCSICKAGKMLCGKKSCPLLTKIKAYLKIKPLYDQSELVGASPPGLFVGRFGYPNVLAGPLVPPEQGDTSILDNPEAWFGKSFNEIVDMRFKLVRGKHRVNVKKPTKSGKILEETRLLGLSESPVDIDLSFKSKPDSSFTLHSQVQPMGPSAMIEKLKLESNVKTQHFLEKAYSDTDLKAADAVSLLYKQNVKVSSIQKAFSVGSFGLKDKRKLVPTRWSITAVDSMLSKERIQQIKQFPTINEFRVYESNYLDNCFQIIMLPEGWKYESIEAWYPGTIWNPFDQNIGIIGDWEDYRGRTTYASIGGCYYAARLAVNELLMKERRQACVSILREIRPGYIMPVGVWNVRENVRHALKQKPAKYNTFKEVLEHVKGKFHIPIDVWKRNSRIITDTLKQKKITEYLR